MPPIPNCHVMAKPSGSVCNIDCDYCFYLEKDQLYPERQSNWRMSFETLEQFVKQHIEAQQTDDVHFAWQGGEPTLLGLSFYKKVVELCEKYGKGKNIHHGFQTNGLLINDEWCQFFKQHNFLIGVSIDGPEHLHDCYRKSRSNKGTHAKVVSAIELLKKYQVEFNTLTVVNARNVKQPVEVYQFLKSIGSTYLQFIPLVEREALQDPDANHDSAVLLASPGEPLAKMTSWSVDSDEFGQFLNTIFDYWVRHDVGQTFVQMFDSTLNTWLGNPSTMCVTASQCGHAFALEANGDLYQCDHYVYPEYKLGNIHQQTIFDMNNSDEAIKFGQDKRTHLNQKCVDCRYRFACHGGCPKHRFERGPSGKPDHNYLCSGYYKFFAHTEKPMQFMASLIKQRQSPAQIMSYLAQQQTQQQQFAKTHSVGRNDACPCQSGKKFKRCCG